MVLDLPPGTSAFACAAAALILSIHITAGTVGLTSGTVALASRKGSYLHRRAGNWFFVSMLIMSAIGASVAALLPQRLSVVAGALTFYLVGTAWMTVRRKDGGGGRIEMGTLLVAMIIVVVAIAFSVQGIRSPNGLLDGLPSAPGFFFAAVAALAAIGDLKIILRGGVFGTQRIARHLWRMCVALLIAALSLFLGQQQVFPAPLRGSFVMFLPEIAILGTMLYWLVRNRAKRRLGEFDSEVKHRADEVAQARCSPESRML